MAQEKNTSKKGKKQGPDVLEELNTLLGKIPPQTPELEKAVLGAILLQSNSIYDVQSILTPESFYVPAHRVIYDAILRLSLSQKPIDYMTVAEELRINNKLDEVGGVPYLIELTELIGTASHLEYHARIVQQKYIQRELIRVSTEIQKASYDETRDVEDLISYAEGEIFKVSEGSINKDIVRIGDVVKSAKDAIAKAAEENSKGGNANCRGVPSGFTDLDRLTSGWQKSDLIIIAARPSMGKTAFVLSMARNMAVNHGKVVAFFSLEMSSIQLVNRLIAAEIEVQGDKLRNGTLNDSEWQCLETKLHSLEQAKLYIDDTAQITVFELLAKCRRLKRSVGLDVVIIDYLQLMSSGGDSKGSREQEVSTISRSLKAIAKELQVPVIALSQLNRSVETRSNDKRPQLSDLRESGAIEQDADIVAFIHRPYYYGITQDEDGNPTKDLATIIVAKHRNGAVDDVKLRFVQDLAKFQDYDHGVADIMSSDVSDGGGYQTVRSKMNTQTYSDGMSDMGNLSIGSDNSFQNSPLPDDFLGNGNESDPF